MEGGMEGELELVTEEGAILDPVVGKLLGGPEKPKDTLDCALEDGTAVDNMLKTPPGEIESGVTDEGAAGEIMLTMLLCRSEQPVDGLDCIVEYCDIAAEVTTVETLLADLKPGVAEKSLIKLALELPEEDVADIKERTALEMGVLVLKGTVLGVTDKSEVETIDAEPPSVVEGCGAEDDWLEALLADDEPGMEE